MGGAPTEPVSGTFNKSNHSQIEKLLNTLPATKKGVPVNAPEDFNAASLIRAGVPQGDLNTAIQDGRISRADMLGLMADIGAAQTDVKATKHAEEVAQRIAVAYGIDNTKMINGLAKFETLLESRDSRSTEIKAALLDMPRTSSFMTDAIKQAEKIFKQAVPALTPSLAMP